MNALSEAYPGDGPRAYSQLLRDPLYGPYFWGQLFFKTGLWVFNIVAVIVTFQLTSSAFWVGMVSAVQFLPQFLFALHSGKMADQGNPQRQIVVGRFITAAGSFGLGSWIWVVGGVGQLPGITPVLAASLVVGIGFVVGGPAMQSIVPLLIRPGEMATATALNTVPMIVARASGPVLGVSVATHLSAAMAFALAGVANVVFGLIVLTMRLPGRFVQESGGNYAIRSALRYLRQDTVLARLLIATVAIAVGAEPAVTLAPPLAEYLGGGERMVGWIATSFGIGSGLGLLLFAPLCARLGLHRLGWAGLVIIAAGLVATALGSSEFAAMGGLSLSGVGMILALTSVTTEIQNRAPNDLRGRIMALWFVGWMGSRPFAAVLEGYIADILSVCLALLVTAGFVMSVAYVCRPSRLRLSIRL